MGTRAGPPGERHWPIRLGRSQLCKRPMQNAPLPTSCHQQWEALAGQSRRAERPSEAVYGPFETHLRTCHSGAGLGEFVGPKADAICGAPWQSVAAAWGWHGAPAGRLLPASFAHRKGNFRAGVDERWRLDKSECFFIHYVRNSFF